MLFRIKIFSKLNAGLKKISDKLSEAENLLMKCKNLSKLPAKEVEISIEVRLAPFNFRRLVSDFSKIFVDFEKP